MPVFPYLDIQLCIAAVGHGADRFSGQKHLSRFAVDNAQTGKQRQVSVSMFYYNNITISFKWAGKMTVPSYGAITCASGRVL